MLPAFIWRNRWLARGVWFAVIGASIVTVSIGAVQESPLVQFGLQELVRSAPAGVREGGAVPKLEVRPNLGAQAISCSSRLPPGRSPSWAATKPD